MEYRNRGSGGGRKDGSGTREETEEEVCWEGEARERTWRSILHCQDCRDVVARERWIRWYTEVLEHTIADVMVGWNRAGGKASVSCGFTCEIRLEDPLCQESLRDAFQDISKHLTINRRFVLPNLHAHGKLGSWCACMESGEQVGGANNSLYQVSPMKGNRVVFESQGTTKASAR